MAVSGSAGLPQPPRARRATAGAECAAAEGTSRLGADPSTGRRWNALVRIFDALGVIIIIVVDNNNYTQIHTDPSTGRRRNASARIFDALGVIIINNNNNNINKGTNIHTDPSTGLLTERVGAGIQFIGALAPSKPSGV